jgi:hypothetical protein
MIVALLFNLGVLMSSILGLAPLTSPVDLGPPALRGHGTVLTETHSTTDPGLPGSPGRDGLIEADSKGEDDELVAFWLAPTSSVLNRAVAMPRHEPPPATPGVGGGLLHELHHSWQLLC